MDFDWASIVVYVSSAGGLISSVAIFLSYRIILRIPEGKVGVLTAMGVVVRDKESKPKVVTAGMHLIWPWQSARKVSTMILTRDLPVQIIPSADGINFSVNGSVRCVIADPYCSIFRIDDINKFIIEQVMNAIRNSGSKIEGHEFMTQLPEATHEIEVLTIDDNGYEVVVIRIIGISLSGIEPVDKEIVNARKRVDSAIAAAKGIGLDVETDANRVLVLALALAPTTASANGAMTIATQQAHNKKK